MPHQVHIDDAVRRGLSNFAEPVEFVDNEGRILGTFTPSPEQRKRVYEWADSLISAEELERAASQSGGCTTTELLEKLTRL